MSIRLLKLCCFGLLACSLTAVPAVSQGKGKGHNKQDGDDNGHGNGKKKAKHEFDGQDRELITSYYSSRNSNLPPGLASAGETCRRAREAARAKRYATAWIAEADAAVPVNWSGNYHHWSPATAAG